MEETLISLRRVPRDAVLWLAGDLDDPAPLGTLLALTAASPETVQSIQVRVTARGREALAGALDRIHDCGIDDWRGGVRLSGHGPVWRWDGAQRKLFEK